MNYLNFVIVKLSVIGFHKWPKAFEDVGYLKSIHRHTFSIKIIYKVKELDREVEIHTEQKRVKDFLISEYGDPCFFGDMSCEMIAKSILDADSEDSNMYSVSVMEDNDGGGLCIRS